MGSKCSRIMLSKHGWTFLLLGLTAVFIGYLTVWLPGPNVGLQFLGIEMGEWTKFLGMNSRRNLFYLPPIILSSVLLLLSLPWSPKRWQTWVWRLLAIGLSLLIFPAIEDLRGVAQAEYWPRVAWIGLIFLLAGIVAVLGAIYGQRPWLTTVSSLLIFLVALAGAILPTQVYLEVQTAVAPIFGTPVGIGWGVWLNGLGYLLIAGISLRQLIHLLRRK